MNTRLSFVPAMVLAAVASLMGSSRAAADSITLYYDHSITGPGTLVNMTSWGQSSGTNVRSGPYYWTTNGQPINTGNAVATFCVEIPQGFSASNADGSPSGNGSTTYTASSLTAVFDADTEKSISQLYAAHFDSAWNSPTFNGTTQSTAFQLAMWEIVYDGAGGSLAGGNFRVFNQDLNDTNTAAGLAKSWLGSLGSGPSFDSKYAGYKLLGLTNPNSQDQVILVPPSPKCVPAPPGALLAGMGFLALFGRVGWLRRKTAVGVA